VSAHLHLVGVEEARGGLSSYLTATSLLGAADVPPQASRAQRPLAREAAPLCDRCGVVFAVDGALCECCRDRWLDARAEHAALVNTEQDGDPQWL
jgi:predicted amidophosphoribosyltransferase